MKISEKLKKQLEVYESTVGVTNKQFHRGLLDGTKTAIMLVELIEGGTSEDLLDAALEQMKMKAQSLNAKNN